MRGTGTVKAHLVAAGKYHDIDFARLELLKLLAEHPEIRTSVSSDYADTARIEAADLLVTYTCDLVPTPDQTATIRAFLEDRKSTRLTSSHSCASRLPSSARHT